MVASPPIEPDLVAAGETPGVATPAEPATPQHGEGSARQDQSQSQSQVITLNLQNSGDPALEARILGGLHSTGRQLGRLSAVVDLLLDAAAESPRLADPEAQQIVADFRSMRSDIERAKRARAPERYIEQLEQLRNADPDAFVRVTARLREWLQSARA